MNPRHKRFAWIIATTIIILSVLGNLIHLLTESWWFDSVGFSSVFWKILTWKSITWIVAFVLYGGVLWINFRIARSLTKGRTFRSFEDTPFVVPTEKIFNIIIGVGVLVIAFISAGATVHWWEDILKFLHASDFAHTDPLYNKNIGFYFFKLPLYNAMRGWLISLFVLSLIVSGLVYFLKGAIELVQSRHIRFSGSVKTHVSILLAIIALLIAVGFYLDRYELLFSTNGVVYGAGFTDAHAKLISYWVMGAITILIALLFIFSLVRKGLGLLFSGIVGFVLVLVLVNGVYPWFQQKFIVEPNELVKEKPYIEHNINYTRQAYGLDNVERDSFPVQGTLTKEKIQENNATIQNVRLWDWRPLLSTYRQIQEIRLYYKFQDVDIDRYTINGDYRQVMLAAREFEYNQVPSQARTWVNQRLKYTHGYGAVMSPVNVVTEEGLPDLFIKNIPPESKININIDRPAIYYGEESDRYVFTGTSTQEFDYPVGGENKLTTYSGKSGVPIGSIFRRLAYAYDFGSLKILISSYFADSSKVLYYRNIHSRVRKVAPFLQYDSDPYLVIVDGELKWVIDAYTTGTQYPYAEPFARGRQNYIRNSVKVVIDAYDGTMDFYVVDQSDPLIQTYEKIFPDLFKPLETVPPEIRKHFRYPTDLFLIQSRIYLAYHMSDPEAFYNREDLWHMPTEIYEGNEQSLQPYYVIMSLPDQEKEEFLLILPFTPVNKNNMVAWMAARSDGEQYGKLQLFEFPKKELVYGPMQIEARIDQDTQISELLTLWSQKGSSVIRGNMMVIPIEKSLLYVEPIYLKAEQSQIPELKRVVVAYNKDIVMEQTLEKALAVIFGEAEPSETEAIAAAATGAPSGDLQSIKSLIQSANEAFQNALQALHNSNWSAYGEYQNQLKNSLQQLQQKTTTQKE